MTEKQSDHASGEATANITYALRANFFEPDAPTMARAQCADSGIDELPSGSALLVVKRGPNAGSRFVLDQPVTSVGRHPNSDIFCDDITVSRRPTRRIPPPHGAARHCLAPIVGLPPRHSSHRPHRRQTLAPSHRLRQLSRPGLLSERALTLNLANHVQTPDISRSLLRCLLGVGAEIKWRLKQRLGKRSPKRHRRK